MEMRDFILNSEELHYLRRMHKSTKHRQEAYRINAVILLGTGWTLEETANALLLDEETLRSYVNKYQEGGVEGLLKNNYQGRETKLPFEKMKELEEHLKQNLYRTTNEIIHYVYKTYKIVYSRSGMTELLHKLDFSYKKPKLVPRKINIEAQEEFIKTFFDFLETKEDTDAVLFYDSTHPQYHTLADYGWIKKGNDHALPSYSARGHMNISGAIDMDSLDVITQFPERVNAESTLKMFEKIERAYPSAQKVHIILDNAASHKAKGIQGFLKDSKVNLVFLPPYSPNLNLIERLWGYLRRIVLANQHYSSFKEFKEKIKAFFRGLKNKKTELTNLMTLEFQELELPGYT